MDNHHQKPPKRSITRSSVAETEDLLEEGSDEVDPSVFSDLVQQLGFLIPREARGKGHPLNK